MNMVIFNVILSEGKNIAHVEIYDEKLMISIFDYMSVMEVYKFKFRRNFLIYEVKYSLCDADDNVTHSIHYRK